MEKSFQFRVDLEIIHQTWSNVLLLLLFSNHNMYDLRRLTWWYSEQVWKTTTTCTQRIKTEQADYFWQTFHTTYHRQNSKVLGLLFLYIFFLILAFMPVQSKSVYIFKNKKHGKHTHTQTHHNVVHCKLSDWHTLPFCPYQHCGITLTSANSHT